LTKRTLLCILQGYPSGSLEGRASSLGAATGAGTPDQAARRTASGQAGMLGSDMESSGEMLGGQRSVSSDAGECPYRNPIAFSASCLQRHRPCFVSNGCIAGNVLRAPVLRHGAHA
jgi:hypothetical protein